MILSKYERERIGAWVQQAAFKEERAQFEADLQVFAEEYRVSWNGGTEACAVIDKLPEGVVNTQYAHWNEAQNAMGGRGAGGRVAYVPQPSHRASDFSAEATALVRRRKDLAQRALELRYDIQKALLQCRTTKRAREAFPEFSEMLPEESTGGALTVQTGAVRTALCGAGVIKCEETEVEL